MEKEPEKPKCEHSFKTMFGKIDRCAKCGEFPDPTCPKGGTCMAMVTEWAQMWDSEGTPVGLKALAYGCQKCLRPMEVNQ